MCGPDAMQAHAVRAAFQWLIHCLRPVRDITRWPGRRWLRGYAQENRSRRTPFANT